MNENSVMDENIVCAPVLITTLCRDKHFISGVESLKKNMWAVYTDVYIALDFPTSKSHFGGYKKICEYLETSDFSCFKSFNVIKRKSNIGAFCNMELLINEIKDTYDRWIFAEDDIVFSPNFLEYMNKCLKEYEKDNTVIAVNGYSFPLEYCCVSEATHFKQSKVFVAWGVGYWRSKYCEIEKRIKAGYLFESFEQGQKGEKLALLSDENYCWYLDCIFAEKNELYYRMMTDVALSVYMSLTDTCVISPVLSKTKNIGCDGSGVNSKKLDDYKNENFGTYDFSSQVIDDSSVFDLVHDLNKHKEKNESIIGEFMCVSPKKKFKYFLITKIYSLFGIRFVKFLFAMYSKYKNG